MSADQAGTGPGSGGEDLATLAALQTPAGQTALDLAADLLSGGGESGSGGSRGLTGSRGATGSGGLTGSRDPRGPLAAAAALRRQGVEPPVAAAALTQVHLRAAAEPKLGADAGRMLFTRAGLEQATRAEVATRRAARLATAGVGRLADLGCGIGADTIAAARAGIRVTAVEADPLTAAVAEANLTALGLRHLATVACGRAEDAELSHVDAVFCDPARRDAATGRRTFNPAAFSPPWSFVATLPDRVPRTVLKLAPGLDHARIPAGAEAQWVSVGGSLVEATLWCGPLAEVARRATVLHRPHSYPGPQAGSPVPPAAGGGQPCWEQAELTGSGEQQAPVGSVKQYLYDPDPAVVRAHLVAEFAATVTGNLADPAIAYVFADQAHPTPFARCLEVAEVLPFSVKRLRAALRAAGVGRVEIRKRGSALAPEQLRRDLRLRGPHAATVVLTRLAGRPTTLICRPVS